MRQGRIPLWEWGLVAALVLVAWGFRVWQPVEVPPGWRDDELINIHALTGEVLAGHPTLYFLGASGHEPLYHIIHAAVLLLIGMNPIGGHLLSIAMGTLTVPLTYVLARRLFGRPVALGAAALLGSSFWSLMYSRVAIRHVMLLPPALASFYILWRADRSARRISYAPAVVLGLLLAAALYTYPVARLLPLILVAFCLYLLLFHRARLRSSWRTVGKALLVAAVLTAPLWFAIALGRSQDAEAGIGADARITELAVPVRELLAGDPQPLLENAWTTLGMFHASGDVEWLYNLPGRPVFGFLGAALLLAGLLLTLSRWRRPESALLLMWFLAGLSPAVATLPAASLGHTILAQPATYIIVALAPVELWSCVVRRLSHRSASTWLRRIGAVLIAALLAAIAVRDLRDYFWVWPQESLVRFLYRADYRDVARYLDDNPDIKDVAVGSTLMGPWDRLALGDDLRRSGVQARFFEPRRALLLVESTPMVIITDFPRPTGPLADLLGEPAAQVGENVWVYLPSLDLPLVREEPVAVYANGFELLGPVDWPEGGPSPGRDSLVLLAWRAGHSLDLTPVPVVANPPPPGVYAGPRLAVFTHIFTDEGTFVVGDDGLWVETATLRPGDYFLQAHRYSVPADAPPGPYRLEIGLYDPLTGDRWPVLGGEDQPATDRWVVPVAE